MYQGKQSQKQQNTQPQLQPIPNTIEVEYVTYGQGAKACRILTTFDFGYLLQVRSQVQEYTGTDGKMYIDYDMRKAVLMANKETGYTFLNILE